MIRTLLAVLLLAATGAAAQQGEVCRFRALDPENPFRRWLASQEVTCVAAGTPLTFEPGWWNVFARGAGSVSALPLLVDGDAAPASVAPQLVPAATVAPLLPEGHAGVLYAPRRASAFPMDRARVTVPADEPLWLFVLDRATPVAVIPIAPLAAGMERQVDGRSAGRSALVGWLQMADADRAAIAKTSGLTSPAVHAGARDAEPLPPPELLHGAFFLFRDAAPGNAELRVQGRGWLPDRRIVKVQPGVTVAAAPLVVRASGTLVVHWNTNQDLRELDDSIGACREDETAKRVTIVVSRCPPLRAGPVSEENDCTVIREEEVDGFGGSMTFDDVAPGLYRAELRYGKLPPSRGMASVGALRVADLRVLASYYTLYGSVTRGGEPLGEDVRIAMPAGIGFAPAESGEYRAVVYGASFLDTDTQIQVAACDGAPRSIVLTDRPVRPKGRYDIDIPANELAVRVTDTFTTETLPGALVKLEAIGLRGSRAAFTTTRAADEQGNVTWPGVPVRELHLTVTHAGYEKREIEPFTMIESGTSRVDAQLVPLRGMRGKIASERPFENGTVVWFSASGSESERADLAADGTFVYANHHTPDETLAVVSASHPLWVSRSPATERRDVISLAFPNAPTAAFDVWLAASVPPGVSRFIGITIGGIRVPQPVLAQHQSLRDDPPLMRGAGPQHFRDLLATGPIDVLLGPTLDEVAVRVRGMDLFALPQFAGAPRRRLEPGTTDVVFTNGQ